MRDGGTEGRLNWDFAAGIQCQLAPLPCGTKTLFSSDTSTDGPPVRVGKARVAPSDMARRTSMNVWLRGGGPFGPWRPDRDSQLGVGRRSWASLLPFSLEDGRGRHVDWCRSRPLDPTLAAARVTTAIKTERVSLRVTFNLNCGLGWRPYPQIAILLRYACHPRYSALPLLGCHPETVRFDRPGERLFVSPPWSEVSSRAPERWQFWGNSPKRWPRWHYLRSGTTHLDFELNVCHPRTMNKSGYAREFQTPSDHTPTSP